MKDLGAIVRACLTGGRFSASLSNPKAERQFMQMRDLLFLKLGGSVITDKTEPEMLDEDVLRRIVAVIAAEYHAGSRPRLLIGHGGGSFGHHWAGRYQTQLGVRDARGWEGVARVADAMSRLNRLVVRHLLDAGVNAVSMPPSASAICVDRQIAAMSIDALVALLDAELVPVIYGDVVVDRRQGAAIVSTEALFSYLAPILRPRRIVLVGERGVYTADPRRDPDAVRIPLIDETNIEQALSQSGGSHGMDVTGGMAAKVEAMWRLVSSAAELDVALVGPEPDVLAQALRGEAISAGTTIRRSVR
jgi:isopentenyl phosphate kinase